MVVRVILISVSDLNKIHKVIPVLSYPKHTNQSEFE